jgi:hypothetical protein
MRNGMTQETMELLHRLQSAPIGEKAAADTFGIQSGTGIQNYNLEPYAKTLYPVITPIRNKTRRFTNGNGGNSVNWKIITAINPSRTFPGTREGIRGAVIDQTVDSRSALFARLSLENSITEEAIMEAQGFDNALAIEGDNLLRSMFISEEEWLFAGNATGLSQPAAPVGVASAGGALAAAANNYCKVVALTYDGWKRASLANGLTTTFVKTSALAEVQTVNGGCSAVSPASAAGLATTAANGTITWSVTAVPAAFGYAWFTGIAPGAGACTLAAITTINQYVATAAAVGAQVDNGAGYGAGAALGAANNYSNNAGVVFDGLISQSVNPLILSPSGTPTATGYYNSLNGVGLTGDGDGNVNEIDAALQWFYDTWKVSPTTIWTSSKGRRTITQLVLAGGASPLYHLNVNPGGNAAISGGTLVREYENKFAPNGAKAIPIEVHPNLPPNSGKVFFECDEIPYPLANIPGPYRVNCLRDYWQRLWPQITETRFTSVNMFGVLQVYTPFAMGLIDNAANC